MLVPLTYQLHLTSKTPPTVAEMRQQLEYVKTLDIPHLVQLQPHEGTCLIVGPAPSVVDFPLEIRQKRGNGLINLLCSLNGAHQWLIDHGVAPKIHVLFEEDLTDVRQSLGGEPCQKTYYYISSLCKPKIFEQLENYHRVVWHPFMDLVDYPELLKEIFPGEFAVGFTGLTFFRTLAIAQILGYRNFELYGCDSSVKDGERYLPSYQTENTEDIIPLWGTDPRTGDKREFQTVGLLAFQVEQFIKTCQDNPDMNIRIHGDSLLKYVHEARYPNQYKSEGPI